MISPFALKLNLILIAKVFQKEFTKLKLTNMGNMTVNLRMGKKMAKEQ